MTGTMMPMHDSPLYVRPYVSAFKDDSRSGAPCQGAPEVPAISAPLAAGRAIPARCHTYGGPDRQRSSRDVGTLGILAPEPVPGAFDGLVDGVLVDRLPPDTGALAQSVRRPEEAQDVRRIVLG